MWKIALGFALFSGLAIFVLMKSGGDIDMGGEKHGMDASHTEAAASAPQASASK